MRAVLPVATIGVSTNSISSEGISNMEATQTTLGTPPHPRLLTRRKALGLVPASLGALATGVPGADARKRKKKKKKKKPAPVPTCTQTACFVRMWGTEGTGVGEFASPIGVAVTPNGEVFIADSGINRIQRFDANGTFLQAWGTEGTSPGQFRSITGIAIAPNGAVYVADYHNDRVQWFTPDGVPLGQITDAAIPPTAPGLRLRGPSAVAVGPAGHVYVSSQGYLILRFGADGTFLGAWGKFGKGPGEFDVIQEIAVGANGDVYVVDSLNFRVQRFNASGEYLGMWGSRGTADGQFTSPWGIAADASGNIHVTDATVDRIQQFSPTGAFLGAWGTRGSGPGEFVRPAGVAIGPGGNVYVADAGNHRIQQFVLPGPLPPRKKKKKKKKKNRKR
jgi:tripartite motif-containing protein 71